MVKGLGKPGGAPYASPASARGTIEVRLETHHMKFTFQCPELSYLHQAGVSRMFFLAALWRRTQTIILLERSEGIAMAEVSSRVAQGYEHGSVYAELHAQWLSAHINKKTACSNLIASCHTSLVHATDLV